jgi:hypothetical protein
MPLRHIQALLDCKILPASFKTFHKAAQSTSGRPNFCSRFVATLAIVNAHGAVCPHALLGWSDVYDGMD